MGGFAQQLSIRTAANRGLSLWEDLGAVLVGLDAIEAAAVRAACSAKL
jgi:hypothetical protein